MTLMAVTHPTAGNDTQIGCYLGEEYLPTNLFLSSLLYLSRENLDIYSEKCVSSNIFFPERHSHCEVITIHHL